MKSQQPRKKGRKARLKAARKLPTKKETLPQNDEEGSYTPTKATQPQEEACDELWMRWSDAHNWPLFSKMEYEDLEKLVDWAMRESFLK